VLEVSSDSSPQIGQLASDVVEREIEWLDPGLFARGKIHDLTGNPGISKSTLIAGFAAGLSRGHGCFGDGGNEPVNTLLLSAEDDPEDTIVPRLRAANADLTKITLIGAAIEMMTGLVPLTLPDHLSLLVMPISLLELSERQIVI
jgi:hypothetical protein